MGSVSAGDVATRKMNCRLINGGKILTFFNHTSKILLNDGRTDCVRVTTSTSKTTTKPSSTTTKTTTKFTTTTSKTTTKTSTTTVKPTTTSTKSTTTSTKTTTTTTIVTTTQAPTPVATMPPGFKGTNTGIGSWFQANTTDSHTNGNSWCGYKYKDYTLGFAPDIYIMTNGTNAIWPNPLWVTYGTMYCGLEAIVTNTATGVSRILYIADAFDHTYVKAPGSIDILRDKFQELFGKSTTNHNDVIPSVSWVLTGRRSIQYSFKGPGDP
ncbi:hypothetical protein HK098_000544 [Nowakowskiella sp. JEL0407]|nr:hypothetical protein HK098_000544 [Nowakowskiella sp. JEL0407]